MEPDPQEVLDLSSQIWPTVSKALAGRDPMIQGAVLADLVAIWLAGHIVPTDKDLTNKLREDLLAVHVEHVRKLIPVNEAMLMDRIEPKGSG